MTSAVRLAWLGLLLLLTWSRLGVAADSVATDVALKIFLLNPANREITQSLRDDPLVDGWVVRTFWRDVEPAAGKFDWTYLDAMMAQAEQHKKAVSLVIVNGGVNTPDWLMSALPASEKIVFSDRNQFHKNYGHALTIPLYWSPSLLSAKKALFAAVAARYAGRPALVSVGAQCGNSTTDDWNLPYANMSEASQKILRSSFDRLLPACATHVEQLLTLFPRQSIKMAIGAIPPALISEETFFRDLVAAVKRSGQPGRFIVQKHNLSAGSPLPDEPRARYGWSYLKALGVPVGAQMLWPAVDVKSCRMQKMQKPCDAQTMLASALRIAGIYQFSHLEIYNSDFENPQLHQLVSRYRQGEPIAASTSTPTLTPTSAPTSMPTPMPFRRAGNAGPPPGAFAWNAGRRPQAQVWRQNTQALETHWVNELPPRLPPGVSHEVMASKLLKENVGYSVFDASDGKRDQPRDVIYWLHGKGGNEVRALFLADEFRQRLQAVHRTNVIVVFVNGGATSFYSNSKDGKQPVEDMLLTELMPQVEKKYAVTGKRWLQGFSMGGFGALKFFAKYPDKFAGVTAYGAALKSSRFSPRRSDPVSFSQVFAQDMDYFDANTPECWFRKNAALIKAQGKPIRIVAGLDDGTRHMIQPFHQLLLTLGIKHEYVELKGVRHMVREYYDADSGAAFAMLKSLE